jgi:hypothetical protein
VYKPDGTLSEAAGVVKRSGGFFWRISKYVPFGIAFGEPREMSGSTPVGGLV